ncbi:TetR family transcriptional regulator [Streptomyces sp. 3MP-14]|uniref:TetR family transcriptional regulator n=1 Tax=Streptomyces mimosae TaxID=2586635 RepID=A0A5N6A7M7_9ACTN|nr:MULTISPECIES: TetR/AcrR family transcriptional regulator [Streptomyces]KAB8164262.1 TetR family transcriptional regulator [Streptomyces mimosae]KAB8176539.1 TetR family transcriptional regulator [Streptomyces sp. 3MP-14]
MESTIARGGTRAPLRADAARNRERILVAAREAIVEQGPDVALDEVARRAGVGNATVYRHFPDRESLLHHVLIHVSDRITQRAQEALESERDPFEALSRMILDSADERVGGLCGLLSLSVDVHGAELAAGRQRFLKVTEELLARAHASGQLREDVGAGDLLVAVSRLTLTVPGSTCAHDSTLARRHLQIFLDGLRTPPRSQLPGNPTHLADLKDESR